MSDVADGPTADQEKADDTLKALDRFYQKRPHKRTWVRCAPGVYVHDCFRKGHAILREAKVDVDGLYLSPVVGQLLAHTLTGATLYQGYWTNKRLLEGTADTGEDGEPKVSHLGKFDEILQQVSSFISQRAQ